MALPKLLPVSVTSFSHIIDGNYKYVDKTDLIANLAQNTGPFFLARPRRFGKSTLVDTFHELFANGLERFAGLKIEQEGLYTDTNTYSVLHFDFSDFDKSLDACSNLRMQIVEQLTANNIDFDKHEENPGSIWRNFLANHDSLSLVLLVDEYDAPLTSVLDNQEELAQREAILRTFYAIVKKYHSKFRFIYITGITRYANTSIFSAFNNLVDLSFDLKYGALLGFTQEELEFNFKDYIEAAARELNLVEKTEEYSYETVLQLLKYHYYGYCFDSRASTFVYNPWSILKFLAAPYSGFDSYWIDSGAALPALLVKHLDKVNNFLGGNDSDHFFNIDATIVVSKNDLIQQLVDISSESFSFKAFLYQTGYLSIKSVKQQGYFCLGLPNLEVKKAYAAFVLNYLGQKASSKFVQSIQVNFVDNLLQQRYDDVKLAINQLLNVLSYDSVAKFNESAFRDLFKVTVLFAGATNVQSEVHNAFGRCDLMFTFQDTCFVCEFKLASSLADVNQLLAEAEQQISSRGYTKFFGAKKVVALAIVAVNQNKTSSDAVVREIEVIKQVDSK